MKKSEIIKYAILFVLLIFDLQIANAQKQGNIWYFGNYAGLDFNYATPLGLSGALYAADCSSSISDTAGTILFYTNGETIWNKTHQVMVNGSGLLGSNDAGQSSLIIQQPQSTIYYVFTVDYAGGLNGLRYSIVDMNLQNGFGEVTQKNILLYAPTTEKLAGIYDCSNDRYWLITHQWNSGDFYSYEINSSGLISVPVVSTTGSVHIGGSGVNNACGQMSITKDGTKLGVARYLAGEVELFDFDKSNGTISNPQLIPSVTAAWGLDFSADGSKLYVSHILYQTIHQYDLNAGSINAIINSKALVGTVTGIGPTYYSCAMQLGPDNKLYISKWGSHYLATINNPDSAGSACNFSDLGIYIGGATSSNCGLTRTITPNCPIPSSISDMREPHFEIYPNPANDYLTVQTFFPGLTKEYKIEINDMTGKKVLENNFNIKTTFNISQLLNGFYTVILSNGANKYFKKIVIQH